MKTTAATKPTPPIAKGEEKRTSFEETMYQRNLFFVMAVNMTWQLAIAVLVPVIGGYYLDRYFKTTPILLIIGAVVALLGVIGVLMNTLKLANKKAGLKQ